MSILEKSLRKTGLKLEADALPKEQRKVKVFQRLIAAVRAAEAEMIDRQFEIERELNEALEESRQLEHENTQLKFRLAQLQLKETMSEIDTLRAAVSMVFIAGAP